MAMTGASRTQLLQPSSSAGWSLGPSHITKPKGYWYVDSLGHCRDPCTSPDASEQAARCVSGGQCLGGGAGGSVCRTATSLGTYLPSQEAAVLELAHEEGNEEGAQHEDEGEEGGIGLHPGSQRHGVCRECTGVQAALQARWIKLQQGVLCKHLGKGA